MKFVAYEGSLKAIRQFIVSVTYLFVNVKVAIYSDEYGVILVGQNSVNIYRIQNS